MHAQPLAYMKVNGVMCCILIIACKYTYTWYIQQSSEGAHLSWEPPANNAGTITEYSVYLGLKPQPGAQPGTMAFARVYCGAGSSCVVSHSQLGSAHIDTTSKPAIIFRIAAKNDKG